MGFNSVFKGLMNVAPCWSIDSYRRL